MELLTFIQLYPDEVEDLARRCGTKAVYLKQIAYGHRRAGHELARKLEAETGGKVTRYETRPDIYQPPTGRRKQPDKVPA